jgi:CRISPR type III-A-associated protein Csm2
MEDEVQPTAPVSEPEEPKAPAVEPERPAAEKAEPEKPEPAKAEAPKPEARPESKPDARPEGRRPQGQGQPRREDRPPRPQGQGQGQGERRPDRGGDRGGRGPGGDRGGDRGERREGGRPFGGGGRPFDGPPADIELEKLIADSLYLDNQAHAVVVRMRDMDSGTKSQLRRLYNAVRRAVRAPESERQHQFVMLRARLAYTIARHSLRSLDALERLLLQVTRRNDARGYERFKDLFEAIVAYNE